MAKKRVRVPEGLDDEPAEPVYGCAIKAFKKQKERHAAAVAAQEVWPGNKPDPTFLSHILDDDILEELSSSSVLPQFISVMTTKYWGPEERKIPVSFMETTVQELIDKILWFANGWFRGGCGVEFVYSKDGWIRVSRQPGDGHYSYLGPDCQQIPKNQKTMNLDSFVLKTPESEYNRVVAHEFGHALGFPHEHMRQELIRLLDELKTIQYFKRTQGWSERETRQQVLTALKESALTAGPVDPESIMCYQLPGSITKDGKPIPGGMRINDRDAAFAAKIYPRAGGTQVGVVRVDLANRKVFWPEGWVGGPTGSAGHVGVDVEGRRVNHPSDWTGQQGA